MKEVKSYLTENDTTEVLCPSCLKKCWLSDGHKPRIHGCKHIVDIQLMGDFKYLWLFVN